MKRLLIVAMVLVLAAMTCAAFPAGNLQPEEQEAVYSAPAVVVVPEAQPRTVVKAPQTQDVRRSASKEPPLLKYAIPTPAPGNLCTKGWALICP